VLRWPICGDGMGSRGMRLVADDIEILEIASAGEVNGVK
jgi:hypothetical protein